MELDPYGQPDCKKFIFIQTNFEKLRISIKFWKHLLVFLKWKKIQQCISTKTSLSLLQQWDLRWMNLSQNFAQNSLGASSGFEMSDPLSSGKKLKIFWGFEMSWKYFGSLLQLSFVAGFSMSDPLSSGSPSLTVGLPSLSSAVTAKHQHFDSSLSLSTQQLERIHHLCVFYVCVFKAFANKDTFSQWLHSWVLWYCPLMMRLSFYFCLSFFVPVFLFLAPQRTLAWIIITVTMCCKKMWRKKNLDDGDANDNDANNNDANNNDANNNDANNADED